MNKSYIITLVALIILIITGMYWNSLRSELENENTPESRIETIDGQEFVLDTPITESFSNAESNREIYESSAVSSEDTTTGYYHAQTLVTNLAKPFFIGVYYAQTLRQKGIDACSSDNTDTNDSRNQNFAEFLDTDRAIELTRIEKILGQIFIYIQADEIPESICARIIQSESLDGLGLNPVHFIVE